MTDEEIKNRVWEFIKKNKGAGLFEVHDALGIQLNDIAKAFKMLQAERKIVVESDEFSGEKYIGEIKRKAHNRGAKRERKRVLVILQKHAILAEKRGKRVDRFIFSELEDIMTEVKKNE